jgi:hypothetical protein
LIRIHTALVRLKFQIMFTYLNGKQNHEVGLQWFVKHSEKLP